MSFPSVSPLLLFMLCALLTIQFNFAQDDKDIDKDKLYTFLRKMEFNRLLSSVISAYGEPKLSSSIEEKKTISLEKFIYSLGIRHIGLEGAKLITGEVLIMDSGVHLGTLPAYSSGDE